MTKPTIEELTKKHKSELKKKADEYKKLEAEISKGESKENATIKQLKEEIAKRDITERVTKIHAVNKKFEYKKDEMSLPFLDGVITGMSFVAKGNASGVKIPAPEIKTKPTKGWVVKNETGLTKEGEQL